MCLQVCSLLTEREYQHKKDETDTQTKRIKLQLDKNFPDAQVGDTVGIQISLVDRGKSDVRNVLACAMEVAPDKFFKLSMRHSTLKYLYSQSQFQLCHQGLLKLEDIPAVETEETSLHLVASGSAVGNGQGFVRWSCTKKCDTKICLYVRIIKSYILCNSECHNSCLL